MKISRIATMVSCSILISAAVASSQQFSGEYVRLKSEYSAHSGIALSVSDLGIGTREVQEKSISYKDPQAKTLSPDDGIKSSEIDKTIYGGHDHRVDFFQIPTPEAKDDARAVASVSRRSERNTHARGMCTAFLIAKDKMMTASHCFNFEDYRMKAVRFNDHLAAPGLQADLDSYEIDSVETHDFSHDFAIIKIKPNSSGKFPGDIYPVLKLKKTEVPRGTRLYMIGHAAKDYKKYTECSIVVPPYIRPVGKHTFGCDCDAFSGNSGSPVFDATSHLVVGVFWGGQRDSRQIPAADQKTHEYVVPMWKIAETKKFDVGVWPSDVSFASLFLIGPNYITSAHHDFSFKQDRGTLP